jgi:hypothetical protein
MHLPALSFQYMHLLSCTFQFRHLPSYNPQFRHPPSYSPQFMHLPQNRAFAYAPSYRSSCSPQNMHLLLWHFKICTSSYTRVTTFQNMHLARGGSSKYAPSSRGSYTLQNIHLLTLHIFNVHTSRTNHPKYTPSPSEVHILHALPRYARSNLYTSSSGAYFEIPCNFGSVTFSEYTPFFDNFCFLDKFSECPKWVLASKTLRAIPRIRVIYPINFLEIGFLIQNKEYKPTNYSSIEVRRAILTGGPEGR